MRSIDPRFAGTASRDDPRFMTDAKRKPDGYKRSKSETRRENDKADPYFRDVNHIRNMGIV